MEENKKIASDIMESFLNLKRIIENFSFFNFKTLNENDINNYLQRINNKVAILENHFMKIEDFKNEYNRIIEEETKEKT